MTQTDASAAAMSMSGQVTQGTSGVSMTFTPEQIQQLLVALNEPFDPEVVEWRVTNTSGKRGQVVAYADQRAYTDRLNSLVPPAGWTREYAVQTVQNFEVPRKDGKSTIITAKVMVTAKVTIHGLGSHAGTGEEWAIDENALTRAEAQAFKRACSCFGLGRYFYDLPRTWVDLDEILGPQGYRRNHIAALATESLVVTLERYGREGLTPFLPLWERYDRYQGESVEIRQGERLVIGTQAGITAEGALRVEVAGEIRIFTAGEVSLRPAGSPTP